MHEHTIQVCLHTCSRLPCVPSNLGVSHPAGTGGTCTIMAAGLPKCALQLGHAWAQLPHTPAWPIVFQHASKVLLPTPHRGLTCGIAIAIASNTMPQRFPSANQHFQTDHLPIAKAMPPLQMPTNSPTAACHRVLFLAFHKAELHHQ